MAGGRGVGDAAGTMSQTIERMRGLVAAAHTPMAEDGSLRLEVVERQAEVFVSSGVRGVFVCGTTGESHSLAVEERLRVVERWREVISGSGLRMVVHVGHNCQADAVRLAGHAMASGADAISAVAPGYFKPGSVSDLVEFLEPVAAAAAGLPFYYYEIPGLTGVTFPMPELMSALSERLPSFAGVKFTSSNFMGLQECLQFEGGLYDILHGLDEMLLGAWALGARGAVGSTYNYAAPLYLGIIEAFEAGDMERARALQFRSVQLVQVLLRYGVLPAGKALMERLGADCGPVRSPVRRLTEEQKRTLFAEVEEIGCADFFAKW
jgi:N-acetylneuraminate lyase